MSALHDFLNRIETRHATVAVLGLGYVGLPLLQAFYQTGFHVLGFDPNTDKLAQLQAGQSYIQDVPNAQILAMSQDSERVYYSANPADLVQADALLICVPTPLHKSKEPDLGYILAARDAIAPHLRQGQLIVLESTTFPGTTDELLAPVFEAQGLKMGQDFFLAFSPERIDPGNAHFEVTAIPKVIGGITPQCQQAAQALYGTIMQHLHPVSSPRVAETAKILENTFRSVNIALVNEFAGICRALNIDVWEVIDAAATKPFGFMKFTPGPGIGGHCIPLDPHYLIWKARLQGYEPRFMALADQINTAMPATVVQLIMDALNTQGRALKGSQVLILGVAYKANIDDARESPAAQIMTLLLQKGAQLNYHDPHVPHYALSPHSWDSQPLDAHTLATQDAVVVLTPHDAVDYALVAQEAVLIVDTRNVMRRYLGEDSRLFSL